MSDSCDVDMSGKGCYHFLAKGSNVIFHLLGSLSGRRWVAD